MSIGSPGMMFGSTGFPALLILLSFALTIGAATVAANQRHLGVLERVLLIGIAVFAPFVGPIVVFIVSPQLAHPDGRPR